MCRLASPQQAAPTFSKPFFDSALCSAFGNIDVKEEWGIAAAACSLRFLVLACSDLQIIIGDDQRTFVICFTEILLPLIYFPTSDSSKTSLC